MNLTDPRLLAVAQAVRPGSVVADIGTDHGYLVCHLVSRGIVPRAFACDVGEKPLASACAHVEELGLGDQIQCVLTDGLTGLPLEEIDDVVMAGMGGELIAALLDGSRAARQERLRFVLQPMTKAERLRAALYSMGFALTDERGVEAGGFWYPVMTVAYTGRCQEVDEFFAWTGLLPQSGHPDSRALLLRTAQRLRRAGEGMEHAQRGQGEGERYRELSRRILTLTEGGGQA